MKDLTEEMPKLLDLRSVRIDDTFWNRYIRLVPDTLIPYQWEILNDRVKNAVPSHCIKNLQIAAGERKGRYEGAPFQDTDAYKWLEAVACSLETHPDPELEKTADGLIGLIGRAQGPDGYLDSYYTVAEPEGRWKNLEEGHELYTAGHLFEAAAAYHHATGKRQLLDIACRLADLIAVVFGPGEQQCHGYPGHPEIELALVRLYEETGKQAYLELAKYFVDCRGAGENYFLAEERRREEHIFPEFEGYDPVYSQSDKPVREQEKAQGHAVRAVYLYCAMADLAYRTEDEELKNACLRLWKNMTTRQMYVTGSIGSSGILERFTTDWDLPNNCNYSESCASVGLALFGRRMAQYNRDASYMDVVERALYNTVTAGIAADGRRFFYVNPLEVWPDNCLEHTSKEHVKAVRQPWFGVACCPPNIARTLASLGQYLFFKDKDTLFVNLYVSCETDGIRIHSELTGSGYIRADVNKECPYSRLMFRIPGYAGAFRAAVNGQEADEPEKNVKKHYYQVDLGNLAEQSACIELYFDVRPHFIRANPNVREDAGKIALVKGPLVYCLEETDNGKNLPSVFVNPEQKLTEEKGAGDLPEGITAIRFEGRKLETKAWGEDELYGTHRASFASVQLRAVPYFYWCNRHPGEMLVWMKEFWNDEASVCLRNL